MIYVRESLSDGIVFLTQSLRISGGNGSCRLFMLIAAVHRDGDARRASPAERRSSRDAHRSAAARSPRLLPRRATCDQARSCARACRVRAVAPRASARPRRWQALGYQVQDLARGYFSASCTRPERRPGGQQHHQLSFTAAIDLAHRTQRFLAGYRTYRSSFASHRAPRYSWQPGEVLAADLETAQARLSKFQQTKGIVVTDERLDQENARFNMLIGQLASAQAERVETETRLRNTGGETSPDVLGSGAVQGLKAQLAQAETKLSDISSIVGKNHPQRLQLDAQIAELKNQIAAETRRVAGGTSTMNRGSNQKVGELQTMVDQQKRQLLSLRSDRDQIAVYQRDVEAAQRAYDAVSMRLGQVNMEGQNNPTRRR